MWTPHLKKWRSIDQLTPWTSWLRGPCPDHAEGAYTAPASGKPLSWWGWAGCRLPKNPIPLSALRALPLLPHSKISSDAIAYFSFTLIHIPIYAKTRIYHLYMPVARYRRVTASFVCGGIIGLRHRPEPVIFSLTAHRRKSNSAGETSEISIHPCVRCS